MWSVWGQLINRDLNSFGVLPNIIETTAGTTAETETDTCTPTFTAWPKGGNNTSCITEEWISRMCDILTMEYYSALLRNEILIHATT